MTNKFITPSQNDPNRFTSNYQVGTQFHQSASKERRRNIEQYLNSLNGTNEFTVELKQVETAKINMPTGDNGEPTVIIPTYEELESPLQGVSDEVFRAMIQYANALHEYGHHMYTDQPTMSEGFENLTQLIEQQVNNKIGSSSQSLSVYKYTQEIANVCKDILNAIEDGAIEEAVRAEHDSSAVAQRFAMKNNTFIARPSEEIEKEKSQNVTLIMALHIASMDLAKVDTGSLRRLMDENDTKYQFKNEEHKKAFLSIFKDLQNTVVDSFTTSNARVRKQHIFEFLEEKVVPKIIELGVNPSETNNRDHLRNRQQNDVDDNSSGRSQQQSQGLENNTKKQAANQQAVIVQQQVEIPDDKDGEHDGDDGDNANNSQQQSSSVSSGESNTSEQNSNKTPTSGSSDTDNNSPPNPENTTERNEGGGTGTKTHNQNEEHHQNSTCPSCGSGDIDSVTVRADKEIAARVDAPFDINEPWIDTLEFVSSDKRGVCGFRIMTNKSEEVPVNRIETSEYTVFEITGGIEVLERFDTYPPQTDINGCKCNKCGCEWTPTIGGE